MNENQYNTSETFQGVQSTNDKTLKTNYTRILNWRQKSNVPLKTTPTRIAPEKTATLTLLDGKY